MSATSLDSTVENLSCGELPASVLSQLLAAYGLVLVTVAEGEPGSHWGEPEAGLIGQQLFCRNGIPVHSALHSDQSCQ